MPKQKFISTRSGIPIPFTGTQGLSTNGPPPLGLRPQWVWVELRIREIEEAIARYQERKYPIPQEWDLELASHRSWCAQRSPLPSAA